jgi:hypothetical protein
LGDPLHAGRGGLDAGFDFVGEGEEGFGAADDLAQLRQWWQGAGGDTAGVAFRLGEDVLRPQ